MNPASFVTPVCRKESTHDLDTQVVTHELVRDLDGYAAQKIRSAVQFCKSFPAARIPTHAKCEA